MKANTPVIDFHCHILPGVDHGSKNLDTSLAQLSLMKKAGVDIAVATSHYYPQNETIEDFLGRRETAAAELMGAKDTDIKIALGAEVYAVAGLENAEGIERLTIKGTNTLLLEMPMTYWSNNVIETVMALDDRFDIVLAHIDRYPSEELEKLLYTGIKAQVNARNSIRKSNRKRVIEWIDEGIVHALGSDLHETEDVTTKAFLKLQKYRKFDTEEIFLRAYELIKTAELF